MDDIVNVALILLLKRGIHLGTSGSFRLDTRQESRPDTTAAYRDQDVATREVPITVFNCYNTLTEDTIPFYFVIPVSVLKYFCSINIWQFDDIC